MRGRLVEVVIDFSKTGAFVVDGGALIVRLVFLITKKIVIVIGVKAEAVRVVLNLVVEVERILESLIRNKSSVSLVRKL